LRVVRTPTGALSIDASGRAAGRGAYVCPAAECVDTAIKKGALSRALKTPLSIDVREALVAGIADPIQTTTEGGARGQE
jgi:predicted RNA-binding protein YlxR (DUF448 family)